MPPLSLTALPTEILNQIMTYQEEGTLASLRLTYHLLCEVATPRLFYEFLIQIGREDEHLMTLGQPYLHHIQWLYILASAWITSRFTELDDVYRDCAFHNLDLFDRMPRLRRLWLEGCYSCDGTSDFNAPGSSNDGVDREIDPAEKATQMAMFLRRRSLLAAPEDRIATSLSFLSLTIDENYSRRHWSLEKFASVLLIPSMRDLIVRGKNLKVMSDGAPLPEKYYGQSRLLKLKIVGATIILPALEHLMRFPRALQKLSLREKTLVLPDKDEESVPFERFQRVIETQKSSLESLEINKGFFSADGGRLATSLDLSDFTRMRRYRGYYQDISGRFRALPRMYR